MLQTKTLHSGVGQRCMRVYVRARVLCVSVVFLITYFSIVLAAAFIFSKSKDKSLSGMSCRVSWPAIATENSGSSTTV